MRPSSSKPSSHHTRAPSTASLVPDKDGWYNPDPPLSASTAQPPPRTAPRPGPSTSAGMRPPSSVGMRPPSTASSMRPSSSAPLRPSSSASMRPPSSAAIRSSQSGSVRPSSRAAMRPSSSASLRPPSSASIRPSSSASTVRPGSSASIRRPVSRYSHRAPTRQSSRALPLCETLVTQVTGLTSATDEDSFQVAVEYTARNLDSTMRPGGSTDYKTADKIMKGHSKKARINSADVLADALDKTYAKLKTQFKANSDLDDEIQRSRIPDHLKFLALLSNPPAESTMSNAEAIIDKIDHPQEMKATLTWKDIFAEEPSEGQHWEGVYGHPPGNTAGRWETRSGGSTPSLSPWDSESDLDDGRSSTRLSDIPETPPPTGPPKQTTLEAPLDPLNAYRHRQDVEELQARQYWRSEWRSDAAIDRKFALGNASSLGPSLHRVLGSRATLSIDGPGRESYRHEEDIIREVLTGLQGRRNIMITWVHNGPDSFSFVLSPNAPRLLHLTAGAQASIISSFASLATTLVHLRKFTAAIFAKASASAPQQRNPDGQTLPAYLSRVHRRSTQSLEAFADALDTELRAFDAWCAQREEDICHARAGLGPQLIVSLLSLEKAIRDDFGASFSVLLDIVRTIVRRSQRLQPQDAIPEVWTLPDLPQRASPSAMTALLLDTLLTSAQEHVSMGDGVTARALVRVFSASAEPVWAMMHRWMRDGMPVRDGVLGALPQAGQTQSPLSVLPDEFFVEDSEMLMLDPDFWADGFTLRVGHTGIGQTEEATTELESRPTSVPVFLVHVAELVLATGKVTGLLRALGISTLFDGERTGEDTAGQVWMADWRTFKALLEQPHAHSDEDGAQELTVLSAEAVASSESLSQVVYDELRPYSEMAYEALTKVLVEDCELWAHLNAIEDLFLMRRGDAMSHFIDMLFTRMDSRQPWNDFHFMNSAFRDVVTLYSGRARWIDTSFVRFSFPLKVQGQGGAMQEKNITQTVRALDGLLIEYAVPFPLTYIFGPRTTRVYSSIFTLVLQIRRAKSVLERILVRGGLVVGKHLDAEMKVFYAMRGRLSWFVNTLLNFITTNVIHTQILKFHEAFRQAKSLDEMIRLQNEHLDKLEGRCLLQRNTVALHRALMSILDISLHYTDCFVSFAGDTTHDISRASLRGLNVSRHHHRSRRLRKQRRDVIAFSDTPSILAGSDLSDSSDEEALDEESLAGRSGREPSFSLGASSTSASFMEDGFLARLDKMSSELDALVRFVRRGVESLAAGTGEAAPAFRIFAFSLEDWDR